MAVIHWFDTLIDSVIDVLLYCLANVGLREWTKWQTNEVYEDMAHKDLCGVRVVAVPREGLHDAHNCNYPGLNEADRIAMGQGWEEEAQRFPKRHRISEWDEQQQVQERDLFASARRVAWETNDGDGGGGQVLAGMSWCLWVGFIGRNSDKIHWKAFLRSVCNHVGNYPHGACMLHNAFKKRLTKTIATLFVVVVGVRCIIIDFANI